MFVRRRAFPTTPEKINQSLEPSLSREHHLRIDQRNLVLVFSTPTYR
jgi:hypothetical protein